LLTRLISAIRQRVSNASVRMVSPKAVTSFSRLLSRGEAKTAHFGVDVKGARSIVVVRSDGIGDLVLMSPFLRELRRSNPSAWITLVVDAKFKNLVELCPYVSEVLGFDLNYRGRAIVPSLVLRSWRLSKRHLKPRRFDLALVPRWDVDFYHSTYVAYFSGAGCRIAYSENVHAGKQLLNRDFDRLLTRAIDDRTRKHELERNLDFLRDAGVTVEDGRLEAWLSEEDRETAKRALSSSGVTTNEPLIGINPGAGHDKRLWPLERFAELGNLLKCEFGARFMILGGPEDSVRGSTLQKELGSAAINFAGQMTLRQTAALLEHTPLMISNDSGLMHLAAAVGASVLEISCHPRGGDPNHGNAPDRFHPWCKDYVVLQPDQPSQPCTGACEWNEAHCILGVSVGTVFAAAKSLLTGRQGDALPAAVG
jgi:ADP-heptose:LPS heptosyltransferase